MTDPSTAISAPDDDAVDVAPSNGSRLTGVRDVLGRQFVPGGGPRPRLLEVVLVMVVSVPLAFFRLGSAAVHARIWAEDGEIFLQQAMDHGPLRAMSISYAGYLHVVPRLAAAIVYPLPVRWWGAGLHVVDAFVFAWGAMMVYLGLSDHVHSRIGRGVAALYIVLIPVGWETIGSIANAQWSLVVGAVVALLWTPTSRWGWAAICLATLAATTSSPLGLVVFGCAVVRYALQRGRGSLLVLATTTLGFAAQAIAMLHSPQRHVVQLYNVYGLTGLVKGYFSRVAGDGVFGIDRLLPSGESTSIAAGSVVLIGFALVAVLGAARRWSGPWMVTALLVALSIGTYLVAALLEPRPLAFGSVIVGSRYYAPPAQFLVLGMLVLGIGLTERRLAVRATETRTIAAERGARSILGVVVLALIGALAFAMVTTYNEADLRGRNSTPTWGHVVRVAEAECRAAPNRSYVKVKILPTSADWFVNLRCARLRGG